MRLITAVFNRLNNSPIQRSSLELTVHLSPHSSRLITSWGRVPQSIHCDCGKRPVPHLAQLSAPRCTPHRSCYRQAIMLPCTVHRYGQLAPIILLSGKEHHLSLDQDSHGNQQSTRHTWRYFKGQLGSGWMGSAF